MIVNYLVVVLCYYPIKSMVLGIKTVFKHQYLQMFCIKLNTDESFSHTMCQWTNPGGLICDRV